MTFEKSQMEVPTIKEAIMIADILDEAGFYNDASLMDEFIEKAYQHENNLVKQAGIFSGIWNRLSGLAKRFFFKEYRQMYKIAKEANKAIGERVDEALSLYKEANDDFKNYELVAWREKMLKLPIYTKDLMVDYERAFGRLVAFTYKLQEQGQVSSKKPEGVDVREITPPGEGGEGAEKPTEGGKEEVKRLTPDTRFMKEKGWSRDPLVPSIAKNDLSNEIAIDKEKFDKYLRTHIVDASKDPDKDWFKLGPHERKMPKGLREAMGNRVWQRTSADGDWVYLSPVKKEDKIIVPPQKLPDEPSLPKPKMFEEDEDEAREIARELVDLNLVSPKEFEKVVEDIKGSTEARENLKGKIKQIEEKEIPSQEPEVSKEEKEMAERSFFDKEDLKKIQELKDKYKDKIWAVYTTVKGKQRAKLVNFEDLNPQLRQVSKEMEDSLFEALYLKRSGGKGKAKSVDYPEVSKADLINKFLFSRG